MPRSRPRRRQPSSGRHASFTCRGHRQGVMTITSNRTERVRHFGWRDKNTDVARSILTCCRRVMDSRASRSVARAFTSTKASRGPRRTTRSISPVGALKRRAKTEKPLSRSIHAANRSAPRPDFSARLRLRVTGRPSGRARHCQGEQEPREVRSRRDSTGAQGCAADRGDL